MTTPRACLALLAVPSLLLVAPAARAGSAEAEAAFRAGRKAVESGDYATACARFAESERLEPAPGTLLNLADCETHQGHLVAAHEHFGLAASGFPRGDVRRNIALQREAELEKRLVHLTLRFAPGVPQGAVVHDGDAVLSGSAVGAARLVDPGLRVVIVSAEGREDRPYSLMLKEGDQVEQTLEAGEVRKAAAPAVALPVAPAPGAAGGEAAPSAPPAGDGLRTLGFVLGGVGAAGIVAGAVTGILALDRASTVKSHCPNDACDPQGLDAASQGKWMAPTSTVAFIAGGALLAGGATLVFFRGHPSSGVAVAPSLGPNGGGAVLRADF